MDTVTLVGRLLVSLAAVLGIMWLLGRRMRKNGLGRDTGLIEVLGRQQLSRTSAVAVVRVGDQALVVGVTETQVSVLGDTDLSAALEGREAGRPKAKARPARVAQAASAASPTPVDPAGPTAARHAGRSTRRNPVAGSALSPQTWKQTMESLRELTARP